MRKFARMLFALAALIVLPATANAQLGFVTGMLLGSSMSGSNTTMHGQNMADIMYVAPRVAERVTDPLGVRTMASPCFSYRYVQEEAGIRSNAKYGYNMPSIREYFGHTVGLNWKDYEILQAVRTTATDNSGCVRIIFAFIEKEKVVSLESLKPLTSPTQ